MQYKRPGVPKGLGLPFERVQEEGSLCILSNYHVECELDIPYEGSLSTATS